MAGWVPVISPRGSEGRIGAVACLLFSTWALRPAISAGPAALSTSSWATFAVCGSSVLSVEASMFTASKRALASSVSRLLRNTRS